MKLWEVITVPFVWKLQIKDLILKTFCETVDKFFCCVAFDNSVARKFCKIIVKKLVFPNFSRNIGNHFLAVLYNFSYEKLGNSETLTKFPHCKQHLKRKNSKSKRKSRKKY